jgi:hypothetical protein
MCLLCFASKEKKNRPEQLKDASARSENTQIKTQTTNNEFKLLAD